jgi:hypothetical protein
VIKGRSCASMGCRGFDSRGGFRFVWHGCFVLGEFRKCPRELVGELLIGSYELFVGFS